MSIIKMPFYVDVSTAYKFRTPVQEHIELIRHKKVQRKFLHWDRQIFYALHTALPSASLFDFLDAASKEKRLFPELFRVFSIILL